MKIKKINEWFARRAKDIMKRRWLVILGFVLVLGVSMNGLRTFTIDSSTDNYFLDDDPMLVMSDKFEEIFGNDYFIGILIESDNMFAKETLEKVRELSNELLDSVSYADKITSLTNIEFTQGNEEGMEIMQIVPEEIPESKEQLELIKQKAYSKEHISSRLISKDTRQSWVMLKLRTFPEDWRKESKLSPENMTGLEIEKIVKNEKYTSLNPKATGMPYIVYKKSEYFGKEYFKVMGLATLFAFLMLIFATKSFRGVVFPLVISISSILIVYGLIGYMKYPVDMGSLSMPMLLSLAISIGYSIHIFTFFKKEYLSIGNRKRAVIISLRETGWPIFFTALTTMGALLSFVIIPVKMVQFVGVCTSACVLVTFFSVVLLFPALLSFGGNRKPHKDYQAKGGRFLERILERLGHKILRNPKQIMSVFILLIIFLGFGMSKVEPAFDIEKTMGRRIPYVRDILEIGESEIGSLYSYNLMIELPNVGEAKSPKALNKLQEISDYAKTFSLTKRTTSVLNIIKDMNQVLNNNDPVYFTIPKDKNQTAQILLLYENSGGTESEYWTDYDYKRLRLMVELNSFNSAEAERELQLIESKAQEIFPNSKVSVVGNLPQFVKMMQYVVAGQVSSFFLAILVITLLLMIVFGSIKVGLVGMIPNIVPAIVIGGLMGWLDIPLDMMTVTLIPMILGLAVDDTIHFINHGRLEFHETHSYNIAIIRTFKTVGVALLLTTIIIVVNFLTYTTSTASMYVNLGILAVAGMLSALLSDFFVTPILFKWFKIFGNEK